MCVFQSEQEWEKKWALGLQSILLWVKDFISFTLVWIKAVCLYFCDDCSSTDPFRLGSFKWNEMDDSNPLLHQSFVCGSVGHSSIMKSLWAELSSVKLWECGLCPGDLPHHIWCTFFLSCATIAVILLSSLSPLKSGQILVIHLSIYLPPALHFSGASLVITPLCLKIPAPSTQKRYKGIR